MKEVWLSKLKSSFDNVKIDTVLNYKFDEKDAHKT